MNKDNLYLLIAISFFLGMICICRELLHIRKQKRIYVSNLFGVLWGLIYGLIPFFMFFSYAVNGYEVGGSTIRIDYSNDGLGNLVLWEICAAIGYSFFAFGNKIKLIFGKKVRKEQFDIRNEMPEASIIDLKRLYLCNVLCFIIGIVCLIIWIRGWGGLYNLIQNAPMIRNGSYDQRNPVAFFAKPAKVVLINSVMPLFLIKRKYKQKSNLLLFLISTGLSMLYLLAKDGRMGMAMYICVIFFVIFNLFEEQQNIRKKIWILGGIFFIFILVVLSMNSFTSYIRSGLWISSNNSSIWDSILSEIKFVYVSGQTAVKKLLSDGSPLLFFHDVGYSLFSWVPSSLTPKFFINLWNYNTDLIYANYSAQIPCDMISASLYDLGIFGIILIPFFWGIVLQFFDSLNRKNTKLINKVFYYEISMALLRLVAYSCLYYWVAGLFYLFVVLVVFTVVKKWLIKEIEKNFRTKIAFH